jgi:uncharacterized membrane protein HdeD (DUF308 family)
MSTHPADLARARPATREPILLPAWVPAAAGALSLLVGVVALVWPKPTLLVVGVLFGAYLAVWGTVAILQAAGAEGMATGMRILGILLGVLALLAGLILMVRPGESILTLVWILGFWWCVLGAMELVRAILVPGGRLWAALWGLVALAAGIILLASPEIGLGTLVLIVGIGFILQGLLELTIAWALHEVQS